MRVFPWLRANTNDEMSTEINEVINELTKLQQQELQDLAMLSFNQTSSQSSVEKENRIISFSLFGKHEKYIQGALRNVDLAKLYYPNWICRFYVGTGAQAVPAAVLDELRRKGAEIVQDTGFGNTNGHDMTRFQVALDPRVDRFIVRDVDSRLNARESAAVKEWITSGQPVHVMRDHPTHCKFVILAGMWGATKGALPFLEDALNTWRNTHSYGNDMEFLRAHVWPKVSSKHLAHDSHCCIEHPESKPFPLPRPRAIFVGQAFNDRHRARYDAYALQAVPPSCRKNPLDLYG